MKHNRISAKARFELMKELELLATSPRKQQMTTGEFASEMTRELGENVNTRNIETAIEAIGLRLTDLFKRVNGGGRSIFADVYKLEQRILAIEKRIEGL